MPLEDELKELRNLTPSQKLARIKEFEEKKRRELKEAEELLRETEKEAIEEEEEKVQIPVPQMKAVSPESLETIEAKLLWAAKRGLSVAPERPEEAPPARRQELSEQVEGAAQAGLQSAQYGELVEKSRQEAVIEAYRSSGAKQSEEPYESMTRQQDTITYQKPELRTEVTYEQRTATPGHEAKTQDFYTTGTREKKRRA